MSKPAAPLCMERQRADHLAHPDGTTAPPGVTAWADTSALRPRPAGAALKTVLIISYVFPPAAYVGAHRTLKYCKYLGDVGWRPIVLTIDARDVLVQDTLLADELPAEVEVFRTRDVDPAKWLASRPRRKPRGEAPATNGSSPSEVTHAPSFFSRVKQFLLKALLQSPDSHVFWIPFACFRAGRLLMTRHIDVIYSTSPPHSVHLTAWLLSKCFRKPHVADFRDPWFVKGSKRPPGFSKGALTRFQAWLKRRLVNNASKIVSVSRGERHELIAEIPGLHPGRVEVITNGYDPGDFSHLPGDVEHDGRFTITHAGTLYPEVGREFFEAIERLVTTRPELRQQLRVNLLGKAVTEYRDSIERLSRSGVVHDLGFQPHRTALAWARHSDVLMILLGGSFFLPSHIPAKVFEYLFLGKPILAVAPPGDLTDILRQSGLGVTVPPHDVQGLVTAIEDLHIAFRADRPAVQPNRDYIGRFDRRVLTHTLARVLQEAATARPAKHPRPAVQGAS